MVLLAQITSMSSPAVQAAMVAAGCVVLYVAAKIGYVILKIILGLAGLALLGGAVWWCFLK